MNRVLFVSDSHGMEQELQTIKKRHNVSHYLHAGDSELKADSPYLVNYQSVLGNCDWNATFPSSVVVEEDGVRIFVTHGHLYSVKSSLLKLQYVAAEHDAQIICFGHSHIPYCEKIDGRIFINPGSLRLPRNYPEPSYVIVEWEELSNIKVNYYNVEGDKLADLSKTFSL